MTALDRAARTGPKSTLAPTRASAHAETRARPVEAGRLEGGAPAPARALHIGGGGA